MNCKVFVLALLVLTGSSCKHKTATESSPTTPQETPQPTIPQPQSPAHHKHDDDDEHEGRHHKHEHDDDDDGDDQDDNHDEHHHGKRHHRLPPGQEKKLHGDQSARNYAPGHRKDDR